MTRLALRCTGLLAVTTGTGALLNVSAPKPGTLVSSLIAFIRHPQAAADAHGLDSLAVTVTGALAWLTLAWLVVALVLVAAAAAPGRLGAVACGLSRLLVPAATQRLLAAVLGVTILTGITAGAASAAPGPATPTPIAISALNLDWPTGVAAGPTASPPTATPPSPTPPSPTPPSPPPRAGTPTSAPPTAAPAPPREGGPSRTPAPPTTGDSPGHGTPGDPSDDHGNGPGAGPRGEVVVLRGDTLWTIAARQLGSGASEAQIAREWPRWWSTNYQVVGDDPDVIKPGQRLAPPPAETRAQE